MLDKLAYDFTRLQADEGQQAMLYTAFDFFLTAYTLVDWVKKDTPLTSAESRVLYVLMLIKICGDLANGSKHFRLDDPHRPPKTTLTSYSAPPVFQADSVQATAFQTSWSVWVELSPDEAREAGVPERCPIVALAEKALKHWRGYFDRVAV